MKLSLNKIYALCFTAAMVLCEESNTSDTSDTSDTSASKDGVTIKRAPFFFIRLSDVPKKLTGFEKKLSKKRENFFKVKRTASMPVTSLMPPPLVLDQGNEIESNERIDRKEKRKSKWRAFGIPTSFNFKSQFSNDFFPEQGYDISSYFHGFPAFGLFNVDTSKFVYNNI